MTTAKPRQASAHNSTRTTTKSRRVRTGCLTCRERHLKCDERAPNCMNCHKSNRECKRGVRLNFLDIRVHDLTPPPLSRSWAVRFRDESRDIASEYRGGLSRYAGFDYGKANRDIELKVVLRQQAQLCHDQHPTSSPTKLSILGLDSAPSIGHVKSPVRTPSTTRSSNDGQSPRRRHGRVLKWENATGIASATVLGISKAITCEEPPMWPYGLPKYAPPRSEVLKEDAQSQSTEWQRQPSTRPQPGTRTSKKDQRNTREVGDDAGAAALLALETPATTEREFLRTAEELHYMQIFVEEVAGWLDAFHKEKYFSQLIPYRALKSPMLLNSILACGAYRLALRDPSKNELAEFYFNTANTQLLRYRENPERNKNECAISTIILKMCHHISRSDTRANYATGAGDSRFKECGWNASSRGLGSTCFWLNAFITVLKSLEEGGRLDQDPNKWGLDTCFADPGENDRDGFGDEELWVRRILCILAKVVNFRPSVSMFTEKDIRGNRTLESRLPEWRDLKQLCDKWNDACPRTMHPLGYTCPEKTNPKSNFPKVWQPKREAVFGRLLYHTAQCILTQTNPLEQTMLSEEMSTLQVHHAHEVCGIVAHSDDPGIGLIAVQPLLIASKVLVDHSEQREVLEILARICPEITSSNSGIEAKLKDSWGWDANGCPPRLHSGENTEQKTNTANASNTTTERMMATSPHVAIQSSPLSISQMDVSPEQPHSFPAGFELCIQPYHDWCELPGLPDSLSPSLYSSLS